MKKLYHPKDTENRYHFFKKGEIFQLLSLMGWLMSKEPSLTKISLLLYKARCRSIDAFYRVEAARIPDIRKTLGHYSDQEILIISKIHIPLCMGGKLGLTSALRRQEAERDHLPLL